MGDETLINSLNLIQPGDLVHYHGSITPAHGLYLAHPCPCATCRLRFELAPANLRYRLTDPWGERLGPQCVHRQSITRSTTCA